MSEGVADSPPFMRVVLAGLVVMGCVVPLRDPAGVPCDERGCPSGFQCRGFVCVTASPTPACPAPVGISVVWSQCAEGFVDGGTGALERSAMGPSALGGLRANVPALPLRAMTVTGRVTVSGTLGDAPLPLFRLLDGNTPLVEVTVAKQGPGLTFAHLAQQGFVGMAELSTRTASPVTPSGRSAVLSLRVEPQRLVSLDVDGQRVTQTVGGAGAAPPASVDVSLEVGPFQVPSGTAATTRFEDFELSWTSPSAER